VELEHLAGMEPWLVSEEFGKVADPGPGGPIAERRTQDPARAGGGTRKTQQDLDRRGLPGPVRPEQADELAPADAQAQSGQRRRSTVGLDDPVELDHAV